MTLYFCRNCRLEFEDVVPGRDRCKECCSHDIVEISSSLLRESDEIRGTPPIQNHTKCTDFSSTLYSLYDSVQGVGGVAQK